MDEKIKYIMESTEIKNKLHKIGICPIMGPTGPTGPQGTGIQIMDNYATYDELINNHPIGNPGDCYLVNNSLYVWNIEKNKWDEIGNIQGPTGIGEKIIINSTTTALPDEEAKVIDNFDGLTHSLDFIIPKGEKGESGSKGEIGPTGPQGEKGDIGPTGPIYNSPTSYDSVLFASFAQAHYSKILTFQDTIIIPGDTETFLINDDENISILNSGIYEITLCGQISGVDQSHGAIFYLSNNEGSVIQDLSFELKAGQTTRMDCSETIITKILNPTVLFVRCGITGDNQTANIDFANINLIIKKYNITI